MRPELSRRRRQLLALIFICTTVGKAGCAGNEDDGAEYGTDYLETLQQRMESR